MHANYTLACTMIGVGLIGACLIAYVDKRPQARWGYELQQAGKTIIIIALCFGAAAVYVGQ
jgi:hypothetical protein